MTRLTHFKHVYSEAFSGVSNIFSFWRENVGHQYQKLPCHSISHPPPSSPSIVSFSHNISHRKCSEVENRLELLQRQLNRWCPEVKQSTTWWAQLCTTLFVFLQTRDTYVHRHWSHHAVPSESDGYGSSSLQCRYFSCRSVSQPAQTWTEVGATSQPFRNRTPKNSL